ncbi:hypothetical protein [Puniceibacterium sediminis]|uniref:HdeA/HdeB family protein n=1 Tax=Puniceibacterium sediminis TaxID=1608407 RepID=A0A238V0P3_9RHOB|nr:hypothetical protein [Puniceibacterium sediminis]SNR28040.1 hypothetical protein SAMN06265370_101465 [Puniceibacterium sediminis]
MKFTMLTALAAFTLTASGALALGQKECDLQGGLVMQVVEARKSGADNGAAAQLVQAGLDGEAQKYGAIVPAVVDWVYTLPEAQLGTAVGDSWVEGCLKQ